MESDPMPDPEPAAAKPGQQAAVAETAAAGTLNPAIDQASWPVMPLGGAAAAAAAAAGTQNSQPGVTNPLPVVPASGGAGAGEWSADTVLGFHPIVPSDLGTAATQQLPLPLPLAGAGAAAAQTRFSTADAQRTTGEVHPLGWEGPAFETPGASAAARQRQAADSLLAKVLRISAANKAAAARRQREAAEAAARPQ